MAGSAVRVLVLLSGDGPRRPPEAAPGAPYRVRRRARRAAVPDRVTRDEAPGRAQAARLRFVGRRLVLPDASLPAYLRALPKAEEDVLEQSDSEQNCSAEADARDV